MEAEPKGATSSHPGWAVSSQEGSVCLAAAPHNLQMPPEGSSALRRTEPTLVQVHTRAASLELRCPALASPAGGHLPQSSLTASLIPGWIPVSLSPSVPTFSHFTLEHRPLAAVTVTVGATCPVQEGSAPRVQIPGSQTPRKRPGAIGPGGLAPVPGFLPRKECHVPSLMVMAPAAAGAGGFLGGRRPGSVAPRSW